jgi:short-chain Z-isoprenyl diphosphate synthase
LSTINRVEAPSVPLGRPRFGTSALRPVLGLVYYLYAHRLLRQLRQRPRPRHIGIILDGNRRHGRSLGITEPRALYDLGANKLDEVLAWCVELGIATVTLWVFSTENFRRSAEEVSGILESIAAKLEALAEDPVIHKQRIRVRAIGRRGMLPEVLCRAISAAEKATAGYDRMELNIAVAYGGRQEITDAVKALLSGFKERQATLAEAIEGVTPEAIASHLYTAGAPDPDLIIRTSGELRLSGFLLWQSAHSEYYFTDVLWPAFRKIDFLRAIRSYQQRQRRFGG